MIASSGDPIVAERIDSLSTCGLRSKVGHRKPARVPILGFATTCRITGTGVATWLESTDRGGRRVVQERVRIRIVSGIDCMRAASSSEIESDFDVQDDVAHLWV